MYFVRRLLFSCLKTHKKGFSEIRVFVKIYCVSENTPVIRLKEGYYVDMVYLYENPATYIMKQYVTGLFVLNMMTVCYSACASATTTGNFASFQAFMPPSMSTTLKPAF